MKETTIDISGFMGKMRRLEDGAEEAITQSVINELSLVTLGQLRLRSPVRTGRMRGSVEMSQTKNEASAWYAVDYAPYVEARWQTVNYGGYHVSSGVGPVADTREYLRENAQRICASKLRLLIKRMWT